MINNMKKLMIMGILLAIAGSMQADNFAVANFEIAAGEEKTIDIELVNPDHEFTAFQFDLTLPAGITIPTTLNEDEEVVLDAELTSRKKSDHSLVVEKVGEGVYRFLASSMTNKTFKNSSGAIVTVKIQAASTMDAGSLNGKLSAAACTTPSEVQVNMDDVTFTISATTGINEIEVSNDKPATIYDLKGNTIRKNATSTEGLSKGVYIIDNKKVIVK